MRDHCETQGCAEKAAASLEGKSLCLPHFLACAYESLESISAQIQQPQFHEAQATVVGSFLEECMRFTADVACSASSPSNLERAQVLDILLWATELHGRLRRGPRVAARIPILVRSEDCEHPWEEKTETQVLSQHGLQFACRHEVNENNALTCVRLDNGRRVEARVAWSRPKESGEVEVGIEFITDEDFWGLDC